MENKFKLPFSKSTIIAARYESYVVAILLFVFVWFEKDVSSVAILASLSWGGYRLVQSFYLNMAKHEHLMEMKLNYKEKGLDESNLDVEIDNIENTNYDAEV